MLVGTRQNRILRFLKDSSRRPGETYRYDCTPVAGGCQIKPTRKGASVLDAALVAGFAIGGLKLIQLRFPLRTKFSLRGFTVEIGPGAIVKSGLEINPHLRARISFVR